MNQNWIASEKRRNKNCTLKIKTQRIFHEKYRIVCRKWLRSALRAAAAAAVRKETVVLKHRSELIQGRIHFQKPFISVCYARIFFFSTLLRLSCKNKNEKKNTECMLIIDEETACASIVTSTCSYTEQKKNSPTNGLLEPQRPTEIGTWMEKREMRIITIKTTHSKNQP